jgi:deoxyadenosine/deoxycytidine kinase
MKIAVGGMIAAGKTNLCQRLGEALDIPVMNEYEEKDKVFDNLLKWRYESKPNAEMLLQLYILQNSYTRQQEYSKDFIVDRDIIEHWLFAQENLKAMPEVMNVYNGLFYSYMNTITKPDLYVILDIDWKHFKERMFNRQRSQEVKNFEKNSTYFAALLNNYVQKMRAQCVLFNIPYVVINTNDLTEEEVFDQVMKKVSPVIKRKNKELKQNETTE